MKDTKPTAESQPVNGYGRLPCKLLSEICALSHLEAHVFAVLSMEANRTAKRGPLGEVPHSISGLARMLKISRGSLRRALVGIGERGLILPGSSGSTRIIVIHYLDHEDPPLDHDDPKADHDDPPNPANSNEKQVLAVPSNGNVSEDVVTAARTKKKKPPKKVSWLTWDEGEQRLRTVAGRQEDEEKFVARWKKRIDEEVIYTELDKANLWLVEGDRWQKYSNLGQFFNGWLIRNMGG